ncbi:hypothetical protein RF157_02100, partial [Escherichia coli]|uniref:hypothetical protein n=1 Tax=Escherichia coli TaxID=562 RepID=UPI002813C5E7
TARAGSAMVWQRRPAGRAQVAIVGARLRAHQAQRWQQQSQQPLWPPVNRMRMRKVDSLVHAHQTAWLPSR